MGLIQMYLENMALYMLITLPIYMIARVLFLRRQKKKIKRWREIVLGGFVLYLVGLASQTIIPRWDVGIMSDTGKIYFEVYGLNEFVNVNWIPFQTLNYFFMEENELVSNWGSISLINLLGNVVMFSPIGFLVPYLWPNWKSFWKILALGLSVTILKIGRAHV